MSNMKPLPTRAESARLPADGGDGFNRLVHETSPYLRQHARNPVDWFPWGSQALEKSRREEKPIFLSIGYSTCHWCHVMERESFEKESIARILNEHYVPVKVDREERPDLDEIYMKATQLLTQHGGWPNSLWLTPAGEPFYAGTYFPPEDRQGRPGFATVLLSIARHWREHRDDALAQARHVTEAMQRMTAATEPAPGTHALDYSFMERAVDQLEDAFDERHGGFGTAPKFPPHGSLRLLLAEARRAGGDPRALRLACATLDALASGGIRDHVGGGFHRYSTDERWFLPHFEKMLYDNAQLLRNYADAHAITGEASYREVARELVEWVFREMTDRDGTFYSALDADSEGEEGKCYVWTRAEVDEVLGGEVGEFFANAYHIERAGNFQDEATGAGSESNIPFLTAGVDTLARGARLTPQAFNDRIAAAKRALLARRRERVPPHLDDKILAGWNGLMIGALAHAGHVLGEARYVAAAERAAEIIWQRMWSGAAGLRRSSCQGEVAPIPGFLEDYACLAEGFLDLHRATNKKQYRERAAQLMNFALDRFGEESGDARGAPSGGRGALFSTSRDHEQLILRVQDYYDQASPSGNGVAALVLVELGALTGEQRYLQSARAILEAARGVMRRAPRATESLLLALAHYLTAAGRGGDAARGALQAGQPGAGAHDTMNPTGDARVQGEHLEATAYLSDIHPAPGSSITLALRLQIEADWEIGGKPGVPGAASDAPVEELRVEPPACFTLAAISHSRILTSRTVTDPTMTSRSAAASGAWSEHWITATIDVADSIPPGAQILQISFSAQLCSTESASQPVCLRAQRLTVAIPIEVVRTGSAAGATRYPGIFERGE